MAARSKTNVRVAVTIEPRWFAKETTAGGPMVRPDIWATAMQLTGSKLPTGMKVHSFTCVTFPVEGLTPQGRKALGV